MYKYFVVVFMLIASTSMTTFELNAQSKVELKKSGGKFQLFRNGEPYQINGVGGQTNLDLLVKVGGNSIRTWSVDEIDKVLADAKKHGLSVCVGFWLGHERHGFNYQDQTAVLAQLEKCLATVRKYKDHPSVLFWSIGNEAEGAGTNPAVWYSINHIAREIKKIDQNHPTMTVIAELGENETKIKSIEKFCPHIDIIGINSYGGINSVGKRFQSAGSSKPYIVTEHGPLGPWETGKTSWDSPIESSSTVKAKRYAAGYRDAVANQKGTCLGSYAFLWGSKQETTATWFGMLLPDGTRLGAVDAMTELWTGSPPKNRCPEIASLTIVGSPVVKPGSTIKAALKASDPDGDELTIRWVLRADSGTIGVGGDAQKKEATVSDAVKADGARAIVTMPKGGGGYRLFAYVNDPNRSAAVANIPLRVAAKLKIPTPSAPSKLPYDVYSDQSNGGVFVPSGFMGNADSVTMKLDSTVTPHSGKTCLKAQYNSTSAWGGVLWQSPADDWDGLKPGGANLTGATHLEFWVRGEQGGEVVNFVFGVLDGAQPYRDTAKGELKSVKLSKEWTKLSLPLKELDLRRIKTGFGWSLAGQASPVTFYLDDIRYVVRK